MAKYGLLKRLSLIPKLHFFFPFCYFSSLSLFISKGVALSSPLLHCDPILTLLCTHTHTHTIDRAVYMAKPFFSSPLLPSFYLPLSVLFLSLSLSLSLFFSLSFSVCLLLSLLC